MVPRSGGGRRAATPPWTEQALIMQMNVLKALLQQQHSHLDLKHLSAQCLLLSKILDSLVANKRTPVWRHELLPIIKQVCRYRESPELRAALLILLLSVKDAYRVEWLTSGHPAERDEIFTTLKGLFDSFTTVHASAETSPAPFLQSGGSAATSIREAKAYLDVISSRFYPRLHVNSVFVAVQAKVGYEVLMCDFHVPHMNLQDRVRLYVGQKEHTETSACIITPPQVNFLVNGQQVERRVATGYLDAGAQMPSDVTTLVKVGANVLQVIGEFSVSYFVAVTSSRAIERSASATELEEFVAPTTAASGADPAEVDDEVVEGASRVSLRCPISHQRLVTPVKASTCRHLQCFDYDSFLEINEKRPAWRCPCCNRLISCPDLRIDRQMEKVLKETDEKVYEVMFYQDGTWVPIATGGDQSPDESIIEGSDKPSDFVDLSDYEEDTGRHQNIDLFQPQQDRKPDAQTLQAINHRSTAAAAAAVEHPVTSVPEFAAVQAQPQSSPGFAGPSTPGTVEMQPGPSPLPAINHNFQVTFAQSHVSPGSRGAPGRVYMLSAQLQQQQQQQQQPPPQTGVSSSAAQGEMRWVRQRQPEQHQAAGASQNVQETRPQWRSTGASQHTAPQTQATQQFYANQTMQHAPNSLQQRSSHQQQRPATRSSPPQAPVHQWRSTTSPQPPPATTTTTTTAAEHWRPLQRMRGSITNPSVARGPLSSPPPRVPAAPQMHNFPTTSAGASFPYYAMDPAPVVGTDPAANVSLYNGSTWVNGADFSSAPLLFSGVQTSDGWLSFENLNPPH